MIFRITTCRLFFTFILKLTFPVHKTTNLDKNVDEVLTLSPRDTAEIYETSTPAGVYGWEGLMGFMDGWKGYKKSPSIFFILSRYLADVYNLIIFGLENCQQRSDGFQSFGTCDMILKITFCMCDFLFLY